MDQLVEAHLGPRSSEALLEHLRPICGNDLARFATLPTSFIQAAARHGGLLAKECLDVHGLARRLGGGSSSTSPWLPAQPARSDGPLNFISEVSTFSALHPRRPPGRLWIEQLASGKVTFTGGLIVALEEVFKESQFLTLVNNSQRRDLPLLYTFKDRCSASGCLALLTPWELDQSVAKRPRITTGSAPRERIAALQAAPVDIANPALRHPADLGVEAGIRLMFSSISGSWQAYSSGLRAWGLFVDTLFPFTPHFPASWEALVAFGSLFANPGSMGRYLSHLKFAHRVLRLDTGLIDQVSSPLRRGPRRHFAPRPRPILSRKDASALVRRALARGLVKDARVYAVLFTFMLRAADELWPLQLDGRGSLEHHSRISFTADSATIHLEHRKNAPHGDTVARKCVCSLRQLCGPCALRALVQSHQRARPRHGAPILGASWARSALRRLQDLCLELELPRVSWHAFRRGGASEMLRSGSTVAQILTAGGWRSAAVLRYLRTRDIDSRAALEVAYLASDSD